MLRAVRMFQSLSKPCFAAALLLLAVPAVAQVTSRSDAVGKLLNEWHAAGTAAGLGEITYENRDGQHSPLNAALYPQLQVFQADAKSGPATGPSVMLRLKPTVGNCSMSAPPDKGGSLPRLYQTDPNGQRFLMMQYLANNLMIYPEHQDYDPGGNGIGGYGDLYPSNNACCIISQGSSGSDQPFLNAVLATIAAFPPETQKLLIEKRVLMPTVQAIFRQSNKQVKSEADIVSGAANPVVFDAAQLDEEKMVRAAHDMRPPMVPPVVQIEVTEEDAAESGKDWFEAEPSRPWKLADTPVSVARIMRSNRAEHTLTVSARKSADLMGRPVQLRWQLLQGDPAWVRVEALGNEPAARLHVRWQPPVKTATGILSHRVDIGVFASNGISTSAPAILSFYMLPNEMRFYDEKGRVSEIHYQTHNPHAGLPATAQDARWLKAMLAVSLAGDGLRSRLMEKLVAEKNRQALQKTWLELDSQWQKVSQAESQPERKEEAARLKQLFEQALAKALDQPLPEGGVTVKAGMENAFRAAAGFTRLYFDFQKEVLALAAKSPKASAPADIAAEIRRLQDLGILMEEAGGSVTTSRPPDQLTAADLHAIQGLNLTLLSQAVFPEVLERSTSPAWVDPRMTSPKPWRDVHRYDAEGKLRGWIRYQGGRSVWFDTEGRLLPDGPDAPQKAQAVVYEKNAQGLLDWRAR